MAPTAPAAATAATASTSGNGISLLQYAYRAEKSLAMVAADPGADAPSWSTLEAWQKPEGVNRTCCYSPDGSFYAAASSSGVFVYAISSGSSPSLLKIVPVKNAVGISFSPRGTFIATWVRHTKLDADEQHKNLQVWPTSPTSLKAGVNGGDATGERRAEVDELDEPEQAESENDIVAFTQKDQNNWKLQFTEDEVFALRSIQNEVHVLATAKAFALVDKLRIEGLTSFSLSPGRNPSVAIFVPERKSEPGSVRIHSLSTLAVPSIRKSFFKADRGQMKWNSSGTSLLFLSSTDHDKTGKSYYGETNLYLMTPALQYEARVSLDKDGGIGDFAWNPANGGKEFVVSYGFMPAKSTLFDTRLNVLHDFGALPRNFVSFNPQGRLLCIAGFGNLAGHIDIWDRSTLKKIANFQASNCTECTWSPDGRLLLCSTLSPRLRVDNGVKIYHWSGELVHADLVEDCYQACWRPLLANRFTFPRALSPAPASSEGVRLLSANKAAAAGGEGGVSSPKPVSVGAYRPPGLRNREVPSIFKREDEGGAPYTPTKSDKPAIPGLTGVQQNGHGQGHGGQGRGRGRVVPGAGPPVDGSRQGGQQRREGGQGQQQQNRKGGPNKRNGTSTMMQEMNLNGDQASENPVTPAKVDPSATPVTNDVASDPMALGSPLTPEDKKRRALQKKLGAIEQLKAKRTAGEKLEKTQEKKIETEEEIRKELRELGGTAQYTPSYV